MVHHFIRAIIFIQYGVGVMVRSLLQYPKSDMLNHQSLYLAELSL